MNGTSRVPALATGLYDMMVRRAPVNVFLFDDNLVCRYAAPVGDEFLGRPRDEFMGRHAVEVLPVTDGLRPVLERAAREAVPWRDPEYHFTVSDGEGEQRQCWAIEIEPVVVDDYHGVLVAWSDLSDLIDERDRLRSEVEELRRRDEERRKAIAELVADVRTLLTPALGYLQVIIRRPRILGGQPITNVLADHVLPRLNDVVRSMDRLREPVPR